jgi:8-oxo-dGTP pyrophosphatase MutT (NUDIX family)
MQALKDIAMPQEETKNPWITVSGEPKYDNKWISVTEFQVINPSGGRGIYGKVHFKNKAVGIIPLDDDLNTWLVGQYRYTIDEWSWEIPEGGSPMELEPLECAKRELKEETGLTANHWTPLMRLHTSNSVTDEEGFIFIARDLEQGENSLEETEAGLKVWKLPFQDALKMVTDGKITDSLSVMGILMAARKLGF